MEWLSRHEDNIIAVHCKAGKGRTGLMLSCWLLKAGICPDAHTALNLFGYQRTHDGKVDTINAIYPCNSIHVGEISSVLCVCVCL